MTNDEPRPIPGQVSRAWLLYDMGSSAYALSVGTLYFPIFFNQYGGRGQATTTHFVIAVLLSTVLVAVLAPLIGAWADARGRRNFVFRVVGWCSVGGTVLLPLCADVDVWAALAMFVVTNVTFLLATNMYDSYISLLGSLDKNYTKRSGAGWGLGYFGGLLCLGVTLILLGFSVPASRNDYWVVFPVAALFYAAFSQYVFSNLPPDLPSRPSSSSLAAVIKTLRTWRTNRRFFLFLIANILIVDGMTTVLYFMSLHATETLKFSLAQVTLVFAIVQLVAVPATISIGKVTRRIREVPLIIATCAGWTILTLLFALGPSFTGMLVMSVLGGFVVGSTPALLRAVMGMVVAPDQRAELFGFASIASRFGTVLGPLIYLVSLRALGPGAALMSAVPAFLLGIGMLVAIRRDLPSNVLVNVGNAETRTSA